MSEHTDEIIDGKCSHGFYKDNVLTRLKQESTWRGLLTVATLAGWHLSPDQAEAIITTGVSLVAAINVFKND
jgi:hypothetical protein